MAAKDPTDIVTKFQRDGQFLKRNGPAHEAGNYCNKKLCFTSTAIAPMARLLYELSLRTDCYTVKLDHEVGRHGMVRGRCFLTSEEAVAELWPKYKVTDDVLCTVQDDDFTVRFREP